MLLECGKIWMRNFILFYFHRHHRHRWPIVLSRPSFFYFLHTIISKYHLCYAGQFTDTSNCWEGGENSNRNSWAIERWRCMTQWNKSSRAELNRVEKTTRYDDATSFQANFFVSSIPFHVCCCLYVLSFKIWNKIIHDAAAATPTEPEWAESECWAMYVCDINRRHRCMLLMLVSRLLQCGDV